LSEANPIEAGEEAAPRTSDPDYLETLARGLQVMLAMGQGRSASIADLAKVTGLPRPSVRRVLYTLVKLGYARGDGRAFTLTPQVTRFAAAYMGTAGRTRLLQARCEELAGELSEIVTVSVLDGDDQLHLGFAVPPNFVGIALGVGSRIPSYMTAGGRLMWAQRSDVEIDAFLARIEPVARTGHTMTDKAAIREAILEARRNGCCVADAEYSSEFKGVAYPIHAVDGTFYGAMTVNARKSVELTESRFAELAARCRSEAARLGAELTH
jgi:IclR family transcriptional regulator, pca regulon regulatory protein